MSERDPVESSLQADRQPAVRRLALVLSSLAAPGGAERVAITMAGGLERRGWDVTLVTHDRSGTPTFFSVPSAVGLIALGGRGPSRNAVRALIVNIRRIIRLRRALRSMQADAIVTFIDQMNVVTIIASIGLGIPVIAAEHNDPSYHSIGPIWDALRRLAYRRARAVVILTEAFQASFEERIRGRIVVIPNPVAAAAAGLQRDHGTAASGAIVSMGRLGPEKGFDVLIRAFAEIAPRHPGWSLVIHGDGDERANLEDIRDRAGLRERVLMPGTTRESAAALAAGEIFVLSSRHEGFPMVLCEAMALGRPVIATSIPGGTRDIVRPDVDAVVVPPDDHLALAAALERLIDEPGLRRQLGERAIEIATRFDHDTILDQWELLLDSAVNRGA